MVLSGVRTRAETCSISAPRISSAASSAAASAAYRSGAQPKPARIEKLRAKASEKPQNGLLEKAVADPGDGERGHQGRGEEDQIVGQSGRADAQEIC